jgi:hypothetical protein
MDVPSYNEIDPYNSNDKILQHSKEPMIDPYANLQPQYQNPQQFQPPYQVPNQAYPAPHQVQPPMQNFQPQTQTYPTPVQNFQPHMQTCQPPIQGGHQHQMHPPVYNPPVVQHTNTNNVIVVQQPSVTPILITRNDSGYPRLDSSLAVLILILNILFPGIGTIVMGCNSTNSGSWICIGILQIFLSMFLIGWIWAIITGIICLSNARR